MKYPLTVLYAGLEQGIADITDIVVNASLEGDSIDWKLAYLELQHITEDAKSTLPLPSKLDFEGKSYAIVSN